MSDYIFEKLSVKINGVEKIYTVPKLGQCPHCNKEIAPYVISTSEADLETRTFAVMAQCPYCSRYFTMAYKLPFGTKVPEPIIYKHSIKKREKELPKELSEISPRFVKIYNEALIAEENDLSELVGVGFKKAIEFLIRDYLIKFKKENEKEVLEQPLKDIMGKISDHRVTQLTATYKWLNSCNFCNRTFDEKDVQEMKKFINVISEYIIYNVLLKK